MSAGSTPGWDYDAGLGLVCEGENVVAVVRGSDPDMADAEQDRRGRLIAAAPDMLAALRKMVSSGGTVADARLALDEARAAIAKATESPGASNLKG